MLVNEVAARVRLIVKGQRKITFLRNFYEVLSFSVEVVRLPRIRSTSVSSFVSSIVIAVSSIFYHWFLFILSFLLDNILGERSC